MKKLIAFFMMVGLAAAAQPSIYRIGKIQFNKQGKELSMPFTKGLGNPQMSQLDVNRDGKKDIVVFERINNTFSIFLNVGDSGKVAYQYAPKFEKKFPTDLYNWALMRDYNCDGLEDLFAYTPGGIKVYKTVLVNNEITFVKVKDMLYAENYDNWGGSVNIWSAYDDMPVIEDVDGDGDLDIMSIMLGENSLSLYKNISKDSAWSCDSLQFKYQARCWGKFALLWSNFDIIENACGGDTIDFRPPPSNNVRLRHGGNTFWVFDQEKDGDYEIMSGDVTFDYPVYGLNIGTKMMARIANKEKIFPSYNLPIKEQYPMGFIMDVNNDGHKDMIVNSHSFNYNGYPKRIHFYKNIPNGDTSKFYFQQNDFLIDQIVDKGKLSKTYFFNYDNDSLMDLLFGNELYCDTFGKCHSSVTLYKNVGTRKKPRFQWVTDDFANLKSRGLENMQLAFGDLNNDGYADLIVGDVYGKLHHLRNVKDANGLATFPSIDTNINAVDLGNFCAPHLVDINGDSLLDLLVGNELHEINYISNKGTKTNFVFDYINSNKSFGGVDTRKIGDIEFPKNKPYVAWDDSLKMPLLFISTLEGKIWVYKINKDSLSKGSFELLTKDLLPETYAEEITVAVTDINDDNKLDIFVGNKVGGIQLFSFGIFDTLIDTLIIEPNRINRTEVSRYAIYPNPTDEELLVELDQNGLWSNKTIVIFDITGQIMYQQKAEGFITKINVGSYRSGVYFVRILSEGRMEGEVKKMIKK